MTPFFGPALQAEDPYSQPDDTWISISGEVEAVYADSFILDYADGSVIVEMNDWDWYDENSDLLAGDSVVVYGRIDDDLFETTSIEASSVYVESLNSYFYASAADEENPDLYSPLYSPGVVTPIVVADVEIRGTVTSVGVREFTVNTGERMLTVDTSLLGYNPLDDKGFQKIDVGDRVLVNGTMDSGFFGDRELEADYLITLEDQNN